MKYMLLVYGDENALTQNEREGCYEESLQLARDIHTKGQYLAAAPLQHSRTASTVKVREGRRLVTSGPFAETHEQLGGYYVVDVDTQEEAIAIAERIPGARWGFIEVRPLVELPPVAN